ncbi:MAG: pyocin activator PrtN family protein [Iodobacter sp.]
MAEFKSACIDVNKCSSFFGINEAELKKRAVLNTLPIPTFATRDSQKAPRVIYIEDLAKYIDKRREEAQTEWQKMNTF